MEHHWKRNLQVAQRLYQSLTNQQETSMLRFNTPYIGVYEISDQYFCEKQVEISRKTGEPETERTRLGKESHESLLKDTQPIKTEESWKLIFSGQKIAIMNMLLITRWKDVVIIGRPDFIYFENAKPLWLLEYKFTKNRVPSDSHHVQARLYSFLVHRMGFDMSNLAYAIVLANTRPTEYQKWRRSVFKSVSKKKISKTEKVVLKIDNGHAFLRRPDLDKAKRELEWALGYWKLEREAIPTKKPTKCIACVHSKICEASLART